MKNAKFFAAALLFAAVGAYAGTDDGNVPDNVTTRAVVQKAAPAPVASSAVTEVRLQDSGIVSPNP